MSAGGHQSGKTLGFTEDKINRAGRSALESDVAHTINADRHPDREAQLAEVIERTIIPTLLSQNLGRIGSIADELHPDQSNIDKLSGLIIGPDNTDALEYIYQLRDQGISLDSLHLELLEPTARYLGELWNRDEIDFFAVTMGINRLQRIVHHFADLDKVEPYDEKRRTLIIVAPGEDHNFGNQLVQKFLKAAGWTVMTQIGSDRDKIIDIVSQDWLAVVGVSISGSAHIQSLTTMLKTIRTHSLNPHIGIMIGGSVIAERPELVQEIGADGTADNAASAVILAKKLLALGLKAAKDAER